MKFSTPLLVLTTLVASVLGTRLRVADDADRHPASSFHHHRHLASVEKYSSSGSGATVQANWMDPSLLCDYGSYLYVNAEDGVTKIQANGKPTTTSSSFVYVYVDQWTDCNETTATHIYTYFDVYNDTTNSIEKLAFSKKKDKAALRLATNALRIIETCSKVCYEYNGDDDFANKEEQDDSYSYCYYSDCFFVSQDLVPVTLAVNWTSTSQPYSYSSTDKYSGPGFTVRNSLSSTARDADATVVITMDEAILEIPDESWWWAYIHDIKRGTFYKF